MENEIFEAIYLYKICNSKTVKISPNKHAGLPDSFENEKVSGTSFQATLSIEFSDKKSYLLTFHKQAKFQYQAVFASQIIRVNVFRVSCLGI